MLEILTKRIEDLCVGDVIVLSVNKYGHPDRTLAVESIERGKSCGGFHLNVKYGPQLTKLKSENSKMMIVPNPLSTAVFSNDGCYNRCVYVNVIVNDLADVG